MSVNIPINMQSTHSRRRRRKGQVTIEALAGLIALIPVFMVLFDIMMMYVGYNQNVSACRDAARAASNADLTGAEDAAIPASGNVPNDSDLRTRATRVLANMKQSTGGYFTGPDIKTMTVQGFTRPDADFGGQYGGTLTLVTTINIRLPVSIPHVTPDTVSFDSSTSFPITGNASSTVTTDLPPPPGL